MNISFFLDELIHLSLTFLVGAFFFWKNRDWRLLPVAILFGFLIDIDHFFDYFAYFGFKFNLSDFVNVSRYMHPAKKIYIIFHGWEFILPLWGLGRWLGKKYQVKNLGWTMALAYLLHLIWDNHSVANHPLAYSFIYRLLNNFSLESFGCLLK